MQKEVTPERKENAFKFEMSQPADDPPALKRRSRVNQSFQELADPLLWRAFCSELLGTTILVLYCIGANENDYREMPNTPVHRILNSGFIVAVIVQTFQHVSGAHVNQALSLGFFLAGQISWIRFCVYMVTQTLGSLLAGGIARVITPSTMYAHFGTLTPQRGVAAWQACMAELIMSFTLTLSVLAVVDKNRNDISGSVPLHCGLIVCINMFFAYNISGGSMNPARVFGPCLVHGVWDSHWIYWVGPFVGSALAAPLYEKFFSAKAGEKISNIRYCRCRKATDNEITADGNERVGTRL